MRHDDMLGEDVLQEEADNVRQMVMGTARLSPETGHVAVVVACRLWMPCSGPPVMSSLWLEHPNTPVAHGPACSLGC